MTCDGTPYNILPVEEGKKMNLTVQEMQINSFVAQNGRLDQVNSLKAHSPQDSLHFFSLRRDMQNQAITM